MTTLTVIIVNHRGLIVNLKDWVEMNRLHNAERAKIIGMLTEDNSMRATSRMAEIWSFCYAKEKNVPA